MNHTRASIPTQKIRIKPGVIVYQDHAYSRWPNLPREIDAITFPEMVFVAQWDGQGWECEASKFGAKGSYGNGHLYVRGEDNVEVLDASTPVTEQPEPTHPPAQASDEPMRAAFETKFAPRGVQRMRNSDGSYQVALIRDRWTIWTHAWNDSIAATKGAKP